MKFSHSFNAFTCVLATLLFSASLSLAVEKTGSITTDETWSGVIEITGNVTITPGVTVTVNPGTIIKLNAGRIIYNDGTFNATGTSGSKIYFTSYADDGLGGDTNGDGGATTPAAGDWARITNEAGDTADMTLKHVEIRYGGGGSSVVVFQGSGEMLIEDVTIQDCASGGIQYAGGILREYTLKNLTLNRLGTTTGHHGVRVSHANVRLTSTNLTSTDVSGRHVNITTGAWTWSSSGTTFSGTGTKAISFSGSTWDGDITWDDNVPYYITGDMRLNPGASLTIGAGSIIKANSSGRITNNGGTLNALGTEAEPIYFTSIFNDVVGGDTNGDAEATTPAPKNWDGFSSGNNDSMSTFTYCHFSYAGDGLDAAINSSRGMVTMEDSSVSQSTRRAVFINDGDVVFRRNTFTDAEWASIWLRNNNGFAILEDNHFEDCLASPYAFDPGVNLQASGTTAINCGNANAIVIDGTNPAIQEDQIWQENLPYLVRIDMTVGAGATWTLPAGTQVKVQLEKKITVRGILDANGTADKPVQFTSINDDSIGGDTNADGDAVLPLPGDWDGFNTWNDSQINFDYTEVHYAGKGSAQSSAAIYFDGRCVFEIKNSTFKNIEHHAISLRQTQEGSIVGNTFLDVGGYGILSRVNGAGPLVTITNNTFENITNDAIYYSLRDNFIVLDNDFTNAGSGDVTRIRAGGIQPGSTVTLQGNKTYVLYNEDESRGELEIAAGGTLIVEAGAVLKFGKFWGIRQDGHMELRGTEENPVILTSIKDDSVGGDSNGDGDATTPAPGDWMSIWIRDTFLSRFNVASGVFENVELRYAGLEPAGSTGTGTPAILHDGGSFEMSNITITDSIDVGFRSRNDISTASIDGLTIIGSPTEAISLMGGEIELNDIYLDEIDGAAFVFRLSQLDFSISNYQYGENMDYNVTRILEGSPRTHVTLGHTPVVAMEGRVGPDFGPDQTLSSITVLPGTVFKVGPSVPFVPMVLSDNGRGYFIFNGEPGNPIIFTSLLDDSVGGDTNRDGDATSPAPGDWDGIGITSPENQINNVEVRYAKVGVNAGYFSGDYTHSLSNLHIHDISGNGITLQSPLNSDISNCLIYDIGERGINLVGNSNSTARVRNTTVSGGKVSIEVSGGSYSIYNNVFYDASEAAFFKYGSETDTPIDSQNNIFYSPGASKGLFREYIFTEEAWEYDGGVNAQLVDPEFVNPAIKDFNPDVGSPMIDAANGTFADGLDLRGFPRFDDPATTDTGSGNPTFADIGAFEQLGSADPTLNPDLTVDGSSITFITTSGKFYSLDELLSHESYSPGQSVEVEFKVMNEGASAALGNWVDALFFSQDANWDINDTLAGTAPRPNTLGAGASYTNSIVTTIPPLIDGSYRLLIRADNSNEQLEFQDYNNASPSTDSYEVEVASRGTAESSSDTFPAGQRTSKLYRIDASAHLGDDLCVQVTATGPNARIELLAAVDRVPTLFDNDSKDDTMGGEEANAQVSITGTGSVYVLVTVDDPGPEPNNVTITTSIKGFSVTSVDPERAGNQGQSTLIVRGAAFRKGDTVSLRHVDGDPMIDASSVIFKNSGRLAATFKFNGEKLGDYDVIVARTAESATLVAGFELIVGVILTETAVPLLSIVIPDVIRITPLSPMPFEITVTNPHNHDIPALVNLEGTLADHEPGGMYSTDRVRTGSSSLRLLPNSEQPGWLRPGETATVTAYWQGADRDASGGGEPGQQKVHQAASASPVDDRESVISNVNEDSIYHDEYINKVGRTVARNHEAASEEATRLAENDVTETDFDVLMQNIYDRTTGIGNNSIGGAILNVSKQPIANTLIKLVSTDPELGHTYEVMTDGQGNFMAENLPSDEYYVVTDGYASSTNTVFVHGGKVVSDNEFCLVTVPPDTIPNDASEYRDLSLIYVEGIPHLFFVRRSLIFTTRFEDGEWTTPEIVAAGTKPVPVYSSTLLEGAPALILFHERVARNASDDIDIPVDPNDIQIMAAVSLPDGEGGWTRHEPVEYIYSENAAFGSFDATLTGDGNRPVVMWTANDITNTDDDTDLYYRSELVGNELVGDELQLVSSAQPAPPQAKYEAPNPFVDEEPRFVDQYQRELPDWEPVKADAIEDACKFFSEKLVVEIEFKKGTTKNQAQWINRKFGSHGFEIKGVLEAAANLKEAKVNGGVDLTLSLFSDELDALNRRPADQNELTDDQKKLVDNSGKGLTVTGSARIGAAWTTNPETCMYDFDKVTASFGVAARARIALPNFTIYAPPLAEVYVGIQIDATFGGDLEWSLPQILPTRGQSFIGGGLGGYFTGKALGEVAEVAGSLTGNFKIEYDTQNSGKGFHLSELSINGAIGATVGPIARAYAVKYNILDGKLTVERSDTFGDPGSGGQWLNHADEEGPTRTIITPDGWEIEETVSFVSKTGSAANYSVVGMATALLADVTSDFEDESRPSLLTTSTGEIYAVWIRERGVAGIELTNDILFSEFDGNTWSSPVTLPTTGANREVRIIEDCNGEILVVYAHADMTGFNTSSNVVEAITAYEDADVCFVRRTDSGWTSEQLLSSIPGTANRLRLHKLPDGELFATWLESDLEGASLHVQMWDCDNQFWLPSNKLTQSQVASNAVLGAIGEETMAIWSEFTTLDGAVGPEERVEELSYATLTNGSWTTPMTLDLPFLTESDDNSSGNLIAPLGAPEGDDSQWEQHAFSDFFNINDKIAIDMGCCQELKEHGTEGIPGVKVPEVFVPDERKWPTGVGSYDPNDKYGLNGYGPEGWIAADQLIPYTITYENDPEEGATAPALRVTISDQLDSDFDYDTFSFTEFGWGELTQGIPEDTQNFSTDVEFENADGSPLIVRVSGSFDRSTGIIGVVFDSIDPVTGFSPWGAFDGFLQVEDGTGNGQGFISYQVIQKADLPQGTEFENTAEIVFDLNDPITTPTVLHTIDLEAPSSDADSPAVANQSAFTVSLNGMDPDGSGIAFYTVYQSINDGPFTVWLAEESSSEPVYIGLAGNKYSFYSVATDWAGLKEAKEPTIEATTIVTASDFGVEFVEMIDEDTVRFILRAPSIPDTTVRVEASDVITPTLWFDVEGATVVDLGDGRFDITAPYTEENRQFFRFIVED